jgi:hypothetical protein
MYELQIADMAVGCERGKKGTVIGRELTAG